MPPHHPNVPSKAAVPASQNALCPRPPSHPSLGTCNQTPAEVSRCRARLLPLPHPTLSTRSHQHLPAQGTDAPLCAAFQRLPSSPRSAPAGADCSHGTDQGCCAWRCSLISRHSSNQGQRHYEQPRFLSLWEERAAERGRVSTRSSSKSALPFPREHSPPPCQ